MYKLIKPLPKEFKIKVNPEQSEAVQKAVFKMGKEWGIHRKSVCHLDEQFLIIYRHSIFHCSNDKIHFKIHKNPEIQFSNYFIKTNQMNKEQIIQEAKQTIDKLQSLIKQVEIEEESKYFDLSKLETIGGNNTCIFTEESAEKAGFAGNGFMQRKGGGKYHRKGFFLSDRYNWELIEEPDGSKILLPTKKT